MHSVLENTSLIHFSGEEKGHTYFEQDPEQKKKSAMDPGCFTAPYNPWY